MDRMQGVFSLGNAVESVSNTFHHEHNNTIVAVTSSFALPPAHCQLKFPLYKAKVTAFIVAQTHAIVFHA